jgi:hypothetical protein
MYAPPLRRENHPNEKSVAMNNSGISLPTSLFLLNFAFRILH